MRFRIIGICIIRILIFSFSFIRVLLFVIRNFGVNIRSILISNDGGIQELPQQDDAGINGLRIWSENRKIFVESPDNLSLELYTATGQLVRILDVVPGTNTYSGFTNGIYIIGQKKLYVK